MSISGIFSTGISDVQSMLGNAQTRKSDFSQLGQDLKSGNLSQAQADFATLSKDLPSGPQNANSQGATDFNTLAQALQSGNLSQAQQAYSSVQQDVQQAGGHHHHHHHHQESSQDSSSQNSTISQDFSTLGQDLQSGNISAAQKAFTSLQTDLQQYMNNYQQSTATQATQGATSGISVSA